MKKAKNELEMLAVRLPGDVVDAVRNYAVANRIGLQNVMREFISNGIKRDLGRLNKGPSLRRSFTGVSKGYKRAKQNEEVIPWIEKKMLAVRLEPELVRAFKSYSLSVEKNLSLLVEEFVRIGMAEVRGEIIDAETLASLTRKSTSAPFRKRKTIGESK